MLTHKISFNLLHIPLYVNIILFNSRYFIPDLESTSVHTQYFSLVILKHFMKLSLVDLTTGLSAAWLLFTFLYQLGLAFLIFYTIFGFLEFYFNTDFIANIANTHAKTQLLHKIAVQACTN